MPYNSLSIMTRWLWSKENKWLLITSVVWLSCVTGGLLFYTLFGHRLIESIYRGESLQFLNEFIANHRRGHPWATPEHYITLGRLLISRIVVVSIVLQLVVVASLKHREVFHIVKEFFSATAQPVNLALFRIVLFYMIFDSVNVSNVSWFSQIPAELRVAPFGVGWLLEFVPINPTWVQVSADLLIVCSFTAMIGLFTRTSAVLTAVLSFYILGIPQFYGKVSHYHHLLWFVAILAASRCGDALSCDAIIASLKRADHGATEVPSPSREYSLPLCFVLLLMGVMYFFAGFWKLWTSGVDWAWSENLKFTMYAKWTELGGWTPFFRIDQYPLLYKLGATGTIIFEVSFIFLVFSKRLRLLAPLGGLFFHTMTDVFMRISFGSLLRCYVAFFDWNRIFNWIGRQLFRDKMYVIYDGNCKLCRRTVATLRVFDILGRVKYLNAFENNVIKDHGLGWLDTAALMTDMHAVVGKKSHTGFMAYRALVARIPLLWPAAPILYLWPIPKVGERIYRHIADSRSCSIVEPSFSCGQGSHTRVEPASGAVKMIGTILFVATVIAGACQLELGWPIACYPTFAWIAGPTVDVVEIDAVRATGEIIPFNEREPIPELPPERFAGLMNQILGAGSEAERRVHIEALWSLFVQNNPSLQQADTVRFYQVMLSTIPERQQENPLGRKLLLEWKPRAH